MIDVLWLTVVFNFSITNSFIIDDEKRFVESRLAEKRHDFTRLFHGGPIERINRYVDEFTLDDLSKTTDFGLAFYTTTSLTYASKVYLFDQIFILLFFKNNILIIIS